MHGESGWGFQMGVETGGAQRYQGREVGRMVNRSRERSRPWRSVLRGRGASGRATSLWSQMSEATLWRLGSRSARVEAGSRFIDCGGKGATAEQPYLPSALRNTRGRKMERREVVHVASHLRSDRPGGPHDVTNRTSLDPEGARVPASG
jgi:hypothetical protein